MTISQLSEVTGVHPSTIKFYISSGLLPRGELIASNRAVYGAVHVDRIRFIRTLVTVGGVSIARLQDVVAALDGGSLTAVLAAAQDAVRDDPAAPSVRESTLDRLRERFGIEAGSPLFHHPSLRRLAAAAEAAEEPLGDGFDEWLDGLIDAADRAASADLALVSHAGSPAVAAQYAVVGIPLGDVILKHARRLWQSTSTTQTYGAGPVRPAED
ncbi:MerR family transcriptional regulator [Microbacterium sp.]|uniref:MerR family transcriptional regulator n=1 Tax=Microbacterium sp. TaxID=51671 RepID=UPI0039E6E0C9